MIFQCKKINIIYKYNKEAQFLWDQEISNEKHLNLKPGIILFSSGTTGLPKMMFHEFSKIFNVLKQPSKRQRDIRILLFLMFYQYIREEILKKKICPHFPFLYSYYVTNNTGIDFNKINLISTLRAVFCCKNISCKIYCQPLDISVARRQLINFHTI